MQNLFDLPTSQLNEELVEKLAETSQIRIERIVSTGQASPPGFWYEQEQAEWVAVLEGEADLLFDDEGQSPVRLRRGDSLLIAAGRRHRVQWTSDTQPTIWLAVFFDQNGSPPQSD